MSNEIMSASEPDDSLEPINVNEPTDVGDQERTVRRIIGEIKHLQNKEKTNYKREIEIALALGERFEKLHEIYRYGNFRKEFKYQSYRKIIAGLGIESTTAHRFRCLYKLSLIPEAFDDAKASATGIHNLKYLAMRYFSKNPVIRNASRTTMGWTPVEHERIQRRIREKGFESVAGYIRDLVWKDLGNIKSAVVIQSELNLPAPKQEENPYLIGAGG